MKKKSYLLVLLFLTALVIACNHFFENYKVWYLVNTLLIIMPIAYFSLNFKADDFDYLTLFLLGLPAVVALFLVLRGSAGTEIQIWDYVNIYVITTYPFITASKFEVLKVIKEIFQGLKKEVP